MLNLQLHSQKSNAESVLLHHGDIWNFRQISDNKIDPKWLTEFELSDYDVDEDGGCISVLFSSHSIADRVPRESTVGTFLRSLRMILPQDTIMVRKTWFLLRFNC